MNVSVWSKNKVLEYLDNIPSDETDKKKNQLKSQFKSEIKGLGSMIIQNGLYGTIAYMKAKDSSNNEYKKIVKILDDGCKYFKKIEKISNFDEMEDNKYLETQDLILDIIKWLRRYVDIFIKEGD